MQKTLDDRAKKPVPEPSVSARAKRWVRIVGSTALLAVIALAGYGIMGRLQRERAAVDTQREAASSIPSVRTELVKVVSGPRGLDLPGTTRPFDSATIFARATGYISKRFVDIGSKVKEGDVLVIIAAPDLDQQLNQARQQVSQIEASIEQVHAQAELAQVTNNRTSVLVQQGWQTKQQGDVDRLTARSQDAALNVAQANLKVQKAVVARLEELTSFERVTAPFGGVITARNVDVGDLVSADNAGGTPMFAMDSSNILRVQVFVPQDSVFALRDGLEAEVTVPELPGRVFKGKVARNAGSLQPGTRTLLTEVDVDNSDGQLKAGIYCTVHFDIPRLKPTIIVPSQALIFDSEGLSAAVYENGKARLKRLDLLRDDGAHVEVRAGLSPGDRVILSPPVNIYDGMAVQPAGDTAATITGPRAAS